MDTQNVTPTFTDEGYSKCFNPLTLEVTHLPNNMEVTWVYAVPDKRGSLVTILEGVPVYGLFTTSFRVVWQKIT